nr:uncharacterized protein C7orf62 homolog [Pogona vitticeps]
MANLVTDSVPRGTLLSALEEKRRQQMKKYLLHRLFFVAMLREEVLDGEITAYHEQLFQRIQKFHLGEPASGVLLIYSRCILHILEASSGTLYHILTDLAALEKQGPKALLQDVKIVVMSHNIPTRLFTQWYTTTVDVPVTLEDVTQSQTTEEVITEALLQDVKIVVMSHNIPTRLFTQWYTTTVDVPVTLEDVTQSQTTEEVITECLTLILKLGVYLATLKVGNKGLSECLHNVVPELLVPAETIQCLCRAKECLSPAQFLEMYSNPLQPSMDSETVWPTPAHMFK